METSRLVPSSLLPLLSCSVLLSAQLWLFPCPFQHLHLCASSPLHPCHASFRPCSRCATAGWLPAQSCSRVHPFCSTNGVVTWRRLPNSLRDLLEKGSVAASLESLMGSMEDGSVVTWGEVLKSLIWVIWKWRCRRDSEVSDGSNGSVVTWGMVRESGVCGYLNRSSFLSSRELCQWSLVSVAFCERSYPQTLSWFFRCRQTPRNCPGASSRLSCGGNVPALARLKPDALTLTFSSFKSVSPALCARMVGRFVSLPFSLGYNRSAPFAAPLFVFVLVFLFTAWHPVHLLVGFIRQVVAVGVWTHRQVGKSPGAHGVII